MKRPKPSPFHRQLTLMLTAAALTACVGQIQSLSQPGQAVDVQAISPIPTIATTEPTVDPYSVTLEAYLTANPPPTPWPADFTPQPAPSSTQTPIPVVINLAKGLPDGEIYVCFVSRANGAFEKYLLPTASVFASSNYFEDIAKLLSLGPGDIIVDAYGLATPVPGIMRPPQ